jgi:hypothetical protein
VGLGVALLPHLEGAYAEPLRYPPGRLLDVPHHDAGVDYLIELDPVLGDDLHPLVLDDHILTGDQMSAQTLRIIFPSLKTVGARPSKAIF